MKNLLLPSIILAAALLFSASMISNALLKLTEASKSQYIQIGGPVEVRSVSR